MAYSKFHEAWEDLPSEDTPISAEALDHIEQGIADAQATADAAGTGDTSLEDWTDLGNLGTTETIAGSEDSFVRKIGTLDQACNITISLIDNQQIELALAQGGVGEFAVTFTGVDSWTTTDGNPPDTSTRATGEVDFFYFEQIDGVTYGSWGTEPPSGAGGVDTSGTPVANDIARFTDADTIEGRSYAELKADLDLEIGTDVQAYDADLTDIAALADVQGDIIVRGAAGWERLAKSATSTDVLTAGASQPSWSAPTAGGVGPASADGVAYVYPGVTGPGIVSVVMVAGTFYYFAAEFDAATTIDRFGVFIDTVLATDEFTLGIYPASSTWQPGSLLVGSGEVAYALNGWKEVTISSTPVPAGRYLMCIQANQASTLQCRRSGALKSGLLVQASNGNSINYFTVAGTYAATLPSTGTTWTSAVTSVSTNGTYAGFSVRPA